jgi:hypothetical protein
LNTFYIITYKYTNNLKIEENYISRTELFDTEYYLRLAQNYKPNITPLQHYLQFGVHDNINPCAWFDGKAYIAAYPDVNASGMNPFYHYCRYGFFEERKSGLLFYQANTLREGIK